MSFLGYACWTAKKCLRLELWQQFFLVLVSLHLPASLWIWSKLLFFFKLRSFKDLSTAGKTFCKLFIAFLQIPISDNLNYQIIICVAFVDRLMCLKQKLVALLTFELLNWPIRADWGVLGALSNLWKKKSGL